MGRDISSEFINERYALTRTVYCNAPRGTLIANHLFAFVNPRFRGVRMEATEVLLVISMNLDDTRTERAQKTGGMSAHRTVHRVAHDERGLHGNGITIDKTRGTLKIARHKVNRLGFASRRG